MDHFHTIRQQHGWKTYKRWSASSEGLCRKAVMQLRKHGLSVCCQLVSATAWWHSKNTGQDDLGKRTKSGEYCKPNSIFGPQQILKALERREAWIDAGRPVPVEHRDIKPAKAQKPAPLPDPAVREKIGKLAEREARRRKRAVG